MEGTRTEVAVTEPPQAPAELRGRGGTRAVAGRVGRIWGDKGQGKVSESEMFTLRDLLGDGDQEAQHASWEVAPHVSPQD